MFSNTNSADCGGFTACSVKPVGCGAGSYTGKATMTASTFALNMRQDVDAGYDETLCIECQNAAGATVQHDNWEIKQIRNCATALGTAGSAYADQTILYDASSTLLTKASGWDQFFLNPHTADCNGITACTITASGCSGSYTAANLVIDNAGVVTAK